MLFLLSISGFAFCSQEKWRVVVFDENLGTQCVALVRSESLIKTRLSLEDSLMEGYTVSFLSQKELDIRSFPTVLFENEANFDNGFKNGVCVIAQISKDQILLFPANKNVQDLPVAYYEFLFEKFFTQFQGSLVFDNSLKKVMLGGNFAAFCDRMWKNQGITIRINIEQNDLKNLNKNGCYFDSGLLDHVIKNYDTLQEQLPQLLFPKPDVELLNKKLQRTIFKDEIFLWFCDDPIHVYCIKKLFPKTYYSVLLKHSNGFQRNFLKYALMPLIMGIILGGLLVKSYLK